ncbi:hypothetical protein EVAR_10754_1 [Eumeta japonica]|uniref:Uncharacterized protein n=1 Tax=Eumeta variegata TaxID=151549 RepID=A0A4C1W5Z5_EUMVA|nr:hypothetical protein EVAR_10754_1 [Eumeta japonica]
MSHGLMINGLYDLPTFLMLFGKYASSHHLAPSNFTFIIRFESLFIYVNRVPTDSRPQQKRRASAAGVPASSESRPSPSRHVEPRTVGVAITCRVTCSATPSIRQNRVALQARDAVRGNPLTVGFLTRTKRNPPLASVDV